MSTYLSRQPEEIARLKAVFLEAIAECGSVREAAKQIGVPRTSVYKWRDHDAEFARSWEESIALGYDGLEDEARRRAFNGVAEPVYFKGEQCGSVQKYSDQLLMFLLQGGKPDRYRQRVSTELTGRNGAPIELSELDRANRIARLLAKCGAAGIRQVIEGGDLGALAGAADDSL